LKQISLTVDGRAYAVAEGRALLRALDEIGVLGGEVEIPHLCWHPALEVSDACGVCAVEIEGEGGLLPACSTKVRDGMVVRTLGPPVLAAREGALTERLTGHPPECPVCDSSGECELQRLAWRFGPRSGVPAPVPVGEPRHVALGRTIRLDRARCIGCGRCVAFTAEVTGGGELGLGEEGGRACVRFDEARPLETAYAMNLVDLCPAGALASDALPMRARVFEQAAVDGVCAGCARGCNVHLDVAHGHVTRMRPRRNAAINQSWLCDAGRLSLHEITRPDRLRGAHVRDATGSLGSAALDSALAWTADSLRDLVEISGAQSIAAITAGHASNEALFTLRRLLRDLGCGGAWLSAPRGESDAWLIHEEKAANAAGARALGFDETRDGVVRIEQEGIRGLIVLGHDALVAPGAPLPSALEALDLLVLIDHRPSSLLRAADVVLAARLPGEREGSLTSCDGWVQRTHAAAAPPVEAWDEGELAHGLAAALSLEGWARGFDVRSVFGDLSAELPAFAGLAFDDLPPGGARLAKKTATRKRVR
jgi:NADH-quinone oxidoreductase subunit G